MSWLQRSRSLVSRYSLKELARALRLRAQMFIDRATKRSLPAARGRSLELPITVPVASAAAQAIAAMIESPVAAPGAVFRIQEATQVEIVRLAAAGGSIDWSRAISGAYGNGRWHWHPYTAASRLLNWIVSAACNPPTEVADANLIGSAVEDHVRFLSARLETHLGGNHLIRELVALILGAEAAPFAGSVRLADASRRLLRTEIARQFIDGAVHFENSPMYHGHVLFDLALVVESLGHQDPSLREAAHGVLSRGGQALGGMRRPDGSYPRFGDSTDGLVPPLDYVMRTVEAAMGAGGLSPMQGLLPGGLYVRRWAAGENWLGFRSWASPPRTCPGHWHDDLLSVELAARGRIILSNAGVYSYDDDSRREYARSVGSHSSPDLGRSQAVKWGSFRVGTVVPSSGSAADDLSWCTGSYRYGPERATVERTVAVDQNGWRVLITDRLPDASDVSVRFVLAPTVDPRVENGQVCFMVDAAKAATLRWSSSARLVAVEEVPFFPRAGQECTSRCLHFRARGESAWTIDLHR